MADEMLGKFPFESQRLLDYMSTPVLSNPQNGRHDSRKRQSQIDTRLQQNDRQLQCRTSEPAFSARHSSEYQLFSLSQTASRRSSNDQRPHSFSSWRGLLNIQDPGAQKHTNQGMKSGIRPLFASLLTVVSTGNSSSAAAVTPDTFATSVSHNLLHIQDKHRTSFKDIPRESFKDMHRDSFKDIRTASFRDTPSDSFKHLPSNRFTDIASNSFTGMHSNSDEDITNDSFTDVSSDSFTVIHSDSFTEIYSDSFTGTQSDSFKDITSESLTDAPRESLSDTSGNAFKHKRRNSMKGKPGDFYKDTPGDLIKYAPGYFYTDKHGDQYKDTSSDIHKDIGGHLYRHTSVDSLKDTRKDLLKDAPEESLKAAPENSLKDTPEDSPKDSPENSPKDAPENSLKYAPEKSLKDISSDYTDQFSNHKTPESEDTIGIKLSTANGATTAVYFSEHQFSEAASPLIDQQQPPIAKQGAPLHPSISVSLLGLLANFLLIAPCVVAFWNSTWIFFDYILRDHECPVSVWTSAAIGFPIMAVVTFLQGSLLSYSTRCNSFFRFILSRSYTYIVSVACVSQWRSVWTIADCYVGSSLLKSAVTFATVFLVLLLSRCLISLGAPPVILAMEVAQNEHFSVNTFRGIKPACSVSFLMDTIINVCVVHIVVITYWRALWEILDFCLFPEAPHLSAISSVGVGVGVSCMMLILQRPIIELSRYLHATNWLLMLIFHDVVAVIYSVVCITYWRGLWMLLDLYTPFRPTSLFIVQSASFVILVICLTGNSILVRNVDRDGSVCAVFDVRFLTTLIHTLRHQPDTKYRTELVLQCPDQDVYL